MTQTPIPAQVRTYTLADRRAVRMIACETADRGEPVDRLLPDRELFADLVTRYYTDYEPQASWVAEQGGEVIGYLTGCYDSRRYRRLMQWRIVPHAFLAAISRGTLWAWPHWHICRAGIRTWWQGGFHRRIPFEQFPAHLHINILAPFRHQHIGPQLVERFLAQARAAALKGVHIAVRSDNVSSCRFFERLGFTELSRHAVTLPDGATYRTHDTVIYGKIL